MAAKFTWSGNTIARLAGLVLLVGGGLYVLLHEPEQPNLEKPAVVRPAKTFVVESAGQLAARSYSGTVKATDLVDLSFRVAGPLVELPVLRGQQVAAGDVLAKIDSRDFQTRVARITSQLEQAQAQLAAMQAGEREEVILRLENALTATRADLDNAKIELDRAQRLLDENVLSQSEFDQAKLRFDVAGEKVKSAEQELAQARKGARQEDIDAQQATIRGLEAQQKEAKDALDDTVLSAPFDGVVAKLYVENFQTVRAQEPVLSLQDVSTIDIVADIPESLVVVVRRENVASLEVAFDSLPGRVFEVEFKELETEADRRTQTYALTVTMQAPEDVHILPGMAATLKVGLTKEFTAQARGIPVPVSAVVQDEGEEPYVWRLDPQSMKVHRVTVKVGEPSGDQLFVQEGLKEGDEIVTAGAHFLEEGMQVRRLASTGQEG